MIPEGWFLLVGVLALNLWCIALVVSQEITKNTNNIIDAIDRHAETMRDIYNDSRNL